MDTIYLESPRLYSLQASYVLRLDSCCCSPCITSHCAGSLLSVRCVGCVRGVGGRGGGGRGGGGGGGGRVEGEGVWRGRGREDVMNSITGQVDRGVGGVEREVRKVKKGEKSRA